MYFFGQIDNFWTAIVTFNHGHLKSGKKIGIITSLQRKGAKKINVSLPAKYKSCEIPRQGSTHVR